MERVGRNVSLYMEVSKTSTVWWKWRWVLFWFLSAPFWLILIYGFSSVGTTNAQMKYWLMRLSLATPIVLLALSFILPGSKVLSFLRIAGSVISVPCGIGLLLFWAFGDEPPQYAHTDHDIGFEPRQEFFIDQARIRLYLTNGGATTAYGTSIRRETPLFGSFYLYEPLYGNGLLMGARMDLSKDSTHLFVIDTLHTVDTLAIIKL